MKISPLQVREVFHLEFLRDLVNTIPLSSFVLKGGSNLRFYFGSIRYSEDMDLDAEGIPVARLRDEVMGVLKSKLIRNRLQTFGIREIVPPDLKSAKQTETVQRFKVHLITEAGEDLFTKVEFSRRGFGSPSAPEAVRASVLAQYCLPPLIVPHYLASAAVKQKIAALRSRRQPEARDIFDLYALSSQVPAKEGARWGGLGPRELKEARERIYEVGYERFRDTVVAYLSAADQRAHDSPSVWDEIRL
ncbi:MAG: nucleotidyl transferase AbiEii/AbiGii toxin family protein, partial [Candidatus Aureabacteria bacterium]|nr:nucleotidyl transferase AbiEii/AbiGii toxin family protein [Candidatus Auribacterota bacterium]